jgi:hypothetical protein
MVTLRYKCNQSVVDANTGNTVSCNTISEYPVDLLSIQPKFGADHNKYVQLTDGVGMTLRYPTFKSFRTIARKDLSADEAFNFLVECVESINDTNAVVMTKDVPREEVVEFINDLNHTQVDKMDAFFESMPKLELKIAFKCPKCSHSEELLVRGLDNFFV